MESTPRSKNGRTEAQPKHLCTNESKITTYLFDFSKTQVAPPTPTFRTSRTNSSASLQSMSSGSNVSTMTGGSGPGPCIHRSHNQLDELKTLKIDHNRMQSIVVSLTEAPAQSFGGANIETSTGDASNTDDLSRSPVKVHLH